MHKFMETVGHILAFIGLVCIVKHFMHHEGCGLCGWQKTKVEGVKTKTEKAKTKVENAKMKVEGVKTKVEDVKTKVGEIKTKVMGLKTKEEGENRTGSRYGSNPVSY
jgi:hypothetical protein